jgi:hypothetical protein
MQSNFAAGAATQLTAVALADRTQIRPPPGPLLAAQLRACGVSVVLPTHPSNAPPGMALLFPFADLPPGERSGVLLLDKLSITTVDGWGQKASILATLISTESPHRPFWKAEAEVSDLPAAWRLYASTLIAKMVADGLVAPCAGTPK